MRSGFTHNYAERYVERFTVTPCSQKLVTTHNVSLRIGEDLPPPGHALKRRVNLVAERRSYCTIAQLSLEILTRGNGSSHTWRPLDCREN